MTLLLAQIFYKSGNYSEALLIFENLLSNQIFEKEQLEVNILACKSQLGHDYSSTWNQKNFDTVYNLALTKLSCEEIKAVKDLVHKCHELLEDDIQSNGDRINAELLSICTMMMENKKCWPEANFLLRKLKTSNKYNIFFKDLFNHFLDSILFKLQ